MNYNQTIDFLFSALGSYQEKGAIAYKPGLERINDFCKHLGNPQRNFFTIHVAGTNGKGSVAHIIASVLQQAGYCTGLFTSPHLNDFRERIKVNGEVIPKQRVVNFANKYQQKMVDLDLSFFEMTTALAFDHFTHSDVEVAVIETGLGGRLDSTNIILPMVSIITNVDLDHTDLLGETIAKIAVEKGGIIKKSIPVIIGESNDEYNHIFEEIAGKMKSKIVYAKDEFTCLEQIQKEDVQSFKIQRSEDKKVFNISLDLQGKYQRKNLLTALTALNLLHNESPLTISRRAMLEGVETAAKSTALNGRWQKLASSPLTICDTGHNPAGIAQVVAQLEEIKCNKLFCVLGFMADKDLETILPTLPKDAEYIFTQTSSDRSMDAAQLKEMAAKAGVEGRVAESVHSAMESLREIATKDDAIFIGGSTYIVADALKTKEATTL